MKITLILVALTCLIGCATASRTNRLRIGMSKQEVVTAMGKPASTAADASGIEVLRYELSATRHDALHHRTEEYFVRLTSGKVERFGRRGDFESHKGPAGIIMDKK